MLKDHYQLGPGESLPHVPFHPDNQRAHRFPGKHPYLFQYHGKHLLRSAVVCTGCVYKIPDPARREEIVEQKQWALFRYEQVKRRAMGPETINYVD
jgi:hypothetical protein